MNKNIAVYDNTVGARTYLSYIAEQAGGFACIGRDGKLYIKTIGEDTVQLDIERFQDFVWGEKFKVSRVAYEDGIRDLKFGNRTNNTVWINQENMYIVDSEQVENIYNELANFECYSFEGNSIIDPAIDAGDIVVIDGKRVIFQGDMEYLGKFKASISSKIQSKSKEDTMTRIPSQKVINRRVESRIDQQDGIIEQTVSEVSEQNNKISRVQQTVDELNSKISDIADITTSQESNSGSLVFEDINQSEPIHVEIVPLGDNISYLYPFEQLYPADNLYIKLRTLRFTNTETNEVFDYELPDDLLYYDNEHYDKFILDYDSQTCYVNKKCAYDNNGNVTCLANEVINSYTFPHINLTDGDYTVQILKYDGVPYGAYLFCRLMAQNIYTTQFATKAELNSEISQTADSITSTVSGTYETKDDAQRQYSQIRQTTDNLTTVVGTKVGENEVCSVISQSPDEINITSNRFSLDSTNFKVTKDGKITAVSGDIGGFSLGTNTFTTNLASEKMAKYTYNSSDITRIRNIIMGSVTPTANDYAKYDFDNSGYITIRDWAIVIQIVNGTQTGKATFTLNTKASENAILLKDNDGNNVFNVGVFGSYINHLSVGNLISSNTIYADGGIVMRDNEDTYLYMGQTEVNGVKNSCIYLYNTNGNYLISMFGETGNITCVSLTQTSKESEKKNTEKYTESAIETLKNIDIYKYNFKNEDDNTKKHIGFVIGDNYKYSEEVTSNKNDGVDLYSFVSLCCKAIQEQQAEIEELKKRLEEQSND